jgi:esterase/lipase
MANKLPFGIGRANTLRAWLSMWSLETSQCQGPPQLAKLIVPALVVQSMADMGVFPSDAHKIYESIAAKDKTLEFLPGAHYFEGSEKFRTDAIDLMAAWILKQ